MHPTSIFTTSMPPKSRKKMKGQARKAKAAAAKANTTVNNNAQRQNSSLGQRYNYNNDGTVTVTSTLHNHTTLTCLHGEHQDITCPVVVNEFLKEFYGIFFTDERKRALDTAYRKYPEAINNEQNLDIVKKNIIQNATSSLLGRRTDGMQVSEITHIMFGYATTLMSIDSYQPSSPITPGSFDQRDAKTFLRNLDITNGCERSLVKFFVNQIPCKCLDEIYSQIKSTKSKMGMCSNCKQMKERTSLFVCTGCERIQFCSKACQLAFAPYHKEYCKVW